MGKERRVPKSGSPFTEHPISSCPPIPPIGVGVRCHWSMRTTVLALESLVGGQLEDWQGPPANQGFLAGSPGHFCLFPKLLTFGNRPDKQILQLHLYGRGREAVPLGRLLPSASPCTPWCLPTAFGFSPSPGVAALPHSFSKSSQSNKGYPEPLAPPGPGVVWGSDYAVRQQRGSQRL